MSMYDFYMYLKHIEYSPENLEFYVWFKNYEAGRLTGITSRPQTKASADRTFDYAPSTPNSSADAAKSFGDEKSFGVSDTASEIAINSEQGTYRPPSHHVP